MKVKSIIDEVAEEMCDHYCKMPEKWEYEHERIETDEQLEKFYEEVCYKCPLNKL